MREVQHWTTYIVIFIQYALAGVVGCVYICGVMVWMILVLLDRLLELLLSYVYQACRADPARGDRYVASHTPFEQDRPERGEDGSRFRA